MSITYTYKVMSVNVQSKCMEIEYSAEGHPLMRISARMPWQNETLETIVQMYSPVAYWQEQIQPVLDVNVGTEGVITPPVIEAPDPNDQANYDMLFEASVEQKVAKALVKFGVLETDPTQISVTSL